MTSRRSLLAFRHIARFLEKAAQGPRAIFIDLEDAVVEALNEARARHRALNKLDWGTGVSVRVKGWHFMGCRDIIDVVEACPRLDYVLLPKCESPADVHARGHDKIR